MKDQDGGGVRYGIHILPQTHQKKIHLHVEQFAQNIYSILAEDLKSSSEEEDLKRSSKKGKKPST